MKFERTINMGHMLTVVAMIIPLVGSFYVTDIRLRELEEDRKVSRELVTVVAIQSEQIGRLRDDLEDLKDALL